MSLIPASTAYCYVEPLKARFAAHLASAERQRLITGEEHRQLKALLDPAGDEPPGRSLLRVDRLVAEDGQPVADEWASALVIGYRSLDNPIVYLDTLLGGLQRFAHRDALLSALSSDRPSGRLRALECLQIEGDPFEQRMLAIIDHQVEHLGGLAARFEQMPLLESALSQSLARNVGMLAPDLLTDLQLPMVQRWATDTGAAHLSTDNQTPIQAALDILTGQPLQPTRRSYFRADGQRVDATHSERYDRWLAQSVVRLKATYGSMLSDYWQQPDAWGQTPRALALRGFMAGFRQALLNAQHLGSLAASYITSLIELLNLPGSDGSSVTCKRLSLTAGECAPMKMAGLMLMTSSAWPDCLIYSALHGFRRFATFKALADHYGAAAGQAELRFHLSLDDQGLLDPGAELKIQAYAITHPPFSDAVDSIIALQHLNLGRVLGEAFDAPHSAAAKTDDALDVRHLLDLRLLSFDDSGRWVPAIESFADRWLPGSPAAPDSAGPGAPAPELTWIQRIGGLEQSVQWLKGTRVDISECARYLLNQYLAIVCDLGFDAADLYVQQLPGPDPSSPGLSAAQPLATKPAQPEHAAPLKLVDLLLERVSGYCPQSLAPTAAVFRSRSGQAPVEPLPLLTPDFLNLMLARVSSTLTTRFLRQLQNTPGQPWRSVHHQRVPADVGRRFLNDMLRLQCELQARLQKIDGDDLLMLEQVLNGPVRSLRAAQGDARVEVYSVYLDTHSDQALALLSNVFILCRPLQPRQHLLCWSAWSGLERFSSFASLKYRFNRRLFAVSSRERWLGLLDEPQRRRIRAYLEQPGPSPLGLQFNRIDDDFVEALLHIEQQRQRNTVELALKDVANGSMPAQIVARLIDVAVRDECMSGALGTLSTAIQQAVLQSTLPPWLSSASIDDLQAYIQLLQRHYLNDDPGEAIIVGLGSLQSFAREQLIDRLNADYPNQVPDPDLIMVTFTQFVPALVATGETPSSLPAATVVHRESLTQFALNHFSNVAGALLVVKFPDHLSIPDFIPPGYFKALVRTLDVGRKYRDQLAAKVALNSAAYAQGRRRFMARIPARMLLLACEMRLQKQLSAQACEFLQNLLDMPDSVARQPIGNLHVTLRPLMLLAATGMQPDRVAGVYLIGPRDERQGPVIVHALFHEAFTFKEFPGKAHLLRDLQTPGSLQTLVLGRVDPVLRKRYDHDGFREAHIPWSTEGFMDGPIGFAEPVQLVGEPVSGNVLQFLFDETLSVLQDICRKQTVTTAEDDWKSLVSLMRLGAEQLLSFLPGHLGLLLAAWQSQTLFQASVDSAYARRWGRALSEFTAALGVLLINRRHHEAERLLPEQAHGKPPATETQLTEQEAAPPDFSWGSRRLSGELTVRLQRLQVRDIALSDLQHDGLYNLYTDARTHKQYTALSGLVYEVSTDQTQWRIVGPNGEQGPEIRRDASQQWQLVLGLGLKGGGGQLTRFQAIESQSAIDRSLMIEARGMSEIRAFYHERANMIIEANVQARRYLENCLFNLVPVKRGGLLPGRTNHLIAEFFGLPWLPPPLIALIRKKARKLYLAVTDPSLASLSSRRYVVGTNRPGNEATAAFISTADPEQKIYLTERFFEQPHYSLQTHARYQGFNASAHYRAGTLIHEMAHLVGDAHDIADLDSSAPFADLLDDSNPQQKAIKDELIHLRATALSHKTPADRLFRKYEQSGWRDIADSDGVMKEVILRITGTTTLARAREVFFADAQKRSQVILSNAESLAVLVMSLGRARVMPDTGPVVSITSSR